MVPIERCSAGRHGGNISSITWHGQPRDDYTLSVPPLSPGRRQQKWLVDAAWLENVRKVLKSFILCTLTISFENALFRSSLFCFYTFISIDLHVKNFMIF